MAIRSLSPEEISARMRDLFAQAKSISASQDLGSIAGGLSTSVSRIAGVNGSGSRVGGGANGETNESLDFQVVLRDAIRGISDAQSTAQAKAQAYQLGDDKVTLEDVMISLQKANLAMQGMVQVRNRLVDAYKEVMNLQV